jgi:hypothetical protein
MSLYWSNTLDFLFEPGSGLPVPKQTNLGPPAQQEFQGAVERVGTGVTSVAGYFRAVVAEAQTTANGVRRRTPSLYQVAFQPADVGTFVSPIDIPCVVPVQLPITAIIAPIRQAALARVNVLEHVIVTAWVGDGEEPYAYGGTLWDTVPAGGVVDVPDWTGAVSVLTPAAVLTWLDFLAAPVGTFTGTYQPRPRRAVQIQNAGQADVPVLFHWSTQ